MIRDKRLRGCVLNAHQLRHFIPRLVELAGSHLSSRCGHACPRPAGSPRDAGLHVRTSKRLSLSKICPGDINQRMHNRATRRHVFLVTGRSRCTSRGGRIRAHWSLGLVQLCPQKQNCLSDLCHEDYRQCPQCARPCIDGECHFDWQRLLGCIRLRHRGTYSWFSHKFSETEGHARLEGLYP